MKTNYLISCDWLQVFGQLHQDVYGRAEIMSPSSAYTIQQQSYSTPVWNEVYIIYEGTIEVATLCRRPRITGMALKSASLKLANRVLYSNNWRNSLKSIMSVLNFEYIGITRIDLCYDCNRLYGGIDVHNFLFDFVTHAPYCYGHIIRSGSRCMTMEATRSNNGALKISALRWGKKSSDKGAYCYNKSLELLQVKDKPWIREAWENAGLLNVWKKEQWDELPAKEKNRLNAIGDSESFIQTPVWRFEVSIKGHGKDLLDMQTGNLFKMDLDAIGTQAGLEEMFYAYAEQVFDFRVSRGQTTIRNYEPMQIFEKSEQPVMAKPYRMSKLADTGRSEKMILNKLIKLQQTYGDIGGFSAKTLSSVIAFLRTISGVKQKETRYKKEEECLNHIKGHMFYRLDMKKYLEWIVYEQERSYEFRGANTWTYWQSLMAIVNEENLRDECTEDSYEEVLNGNASPYDSEFTPFW